MGKKIFENLEKEGLFHKLFAPILQDESFETAL